VGLAGSCVADEDDIALVGDDGGCSVGGELCPLGRPGRGLWGTAEASGSRGRAPASHQGCRWKAGLRWPCLPRWRVWQLRPR
jgi:hypothetical protein